LFNRGNRHRGAVGDFWETLQVQGNSEFLLELHSLPSRTLLAARRQRRESDLAPL